MRLIVCKKCYKASYPMHDDPLMRCSHCGKAIMERRGAARMKGRLNGKAVIGGRSVKAVFTDFSATGACVICRENIFELNTPIELYTTGLDGWTANAVWIKRISPGAIYAGMHYSNPTRQWRSPK